MKIIDSYSLSSNLKEAQKRFEEYRKNYNMELHTKIQPETVGSSTMNSAELMPHFKGATALEYIDTDRE